MRLYVGNLPYQLTEDELRGAFESHGAVANADIVMDRETGRSRGFGFVEMTNSNEAQAAIEALNGQDLGGRKLVVNEARPRAGRGGGGGDRRDGGSRGRRDW